jgi:oxysterol-binding protein-related protein 9/10/11
VEYSQYWLASRELFLAASEEQDPEQRFIKVVRWFIATLRFQYCSRNEKMGSEKKPLNPFLGELFVGKWEGSGEEGDDIILASEQVSHHPPVTGYSIWHDKSGVSIEGYNQIRAGISATTISVKQKGRAIYRLAAFDETYLITLPALHIEGILFGAPYVELEKKSYIQSSSGYKATIEYFGKGYFSGKKNSFKAKIINNSDPDTLLYRITGQWSEVSKIKNEKTGLEVDFFDSTKIETPALFVKPEDEQHELESRRAWTKVAAAIREGNFDKIHFEKSKIENEQREMRKEEEQNGKVWKRMWFEEVDKHGDKDVDSKDLYEAAQAEHDPENAWIFIRDQYNHGEVKI